MPIVTLTASELQNHIGDALDRALREPLLITKHGKPHNVLLSFQEYERLIARDRRVIGLDDWSDEDVAALADARMDPGLDHFDAEIEGK
jgi:prevent-host-death family protein